MRRTPLFDDIPPNIDEPVIVEIIVTGLFESSWKAEWDAPFGKRRSFNVLAHVDRILKGSVDGETIRIAVPPTSCDKPLAVGESGIVIGTPRSSESGAIELYLISESIDGRAMRRERRR
jgi:hypothetical protein